jgi:TPP-dependent pyruvate/acetoin dehydrogenase alpha subunit
MMSARRTGRRWFANAGAEAVAVGSGAALEAEDRLCAPRDYLGAHLALGVRGGERPRGIGSGSTSPDLALAAVGMAVALEGVGCVVTLTREAALATEAWRKAIELAEARSAPLVVVVDRTRPISHPDTRSESPIDSAQPLIGEAADGIDVEAVLTATLAACQRARTGRGPAIVNCVRPAPPRTRWLPARSDPVELFARTLFAAGIPRPRLHEVIAGQTEAVG